MNEKITMAHGSGGSATSELIKKIFADAFKSDIVDAMEDAAAVPGSEKIAMTTDSFVVTPLFFPGGDIGRLSVCGTVNDLLSRGAIPKYMTCGFILEEGASVADLRTIAQSMAETAAEAKIKIVAGDTKVIEGAGGVYINTTGVGFIPEGTDISAMNAAPGDAIIVTGNLGDHHASLLATRMEIDTDIKSDNAPLNEIVDSVREYPIHTIRDVTRGGLATVLKELAESSKNVFTIEEELIPVDKKVSDFSGILGLDPLYMGNEGKMVLILPEENKEEALSRIKGSKYGENARIIGHVIKAETKEEEGCLFVKTRIGGKRVLSVLQGEGLPRIC